MTDETISTDIMNLESGGLRCKIKVECCYEISAQLDIEVL